MNDEPTESSKPEPTPGGWSWLEGRANRREYWLWVTPLTIVSAAIGFTGHPTLVFLPAIIGLFVTIRRLHDVGWTGFAAPLIGIGESLLGYALKAALPMGIASGIGVLVSFAVLIALGAFPGQPGDNRYGAPSPRKSGIAEVFS